MVGPQSCDKRRTRPAATHQPTILWNSCFQFWWLLKNRQLLEPVSFKTRRHAFVLRSNDKAYLWSQNILEQVQDAANFLCSWDTKMPILQCEWIPLLEFREWNGLKFTVGKSLQNETCQSKRPLEDTKDLVFRQTSNSPSPGGRRHFPHHRYKSKDRKFFSKALKNQW